MEKNWSIGLFNFSLSLLFSALLSRRATEGNIVIRPSQLQGGTGHENAEEAEVEEEPSKPIQ